MRGIVLAALAAGLAAAGPVGAAPPIVLSASPTQLTLLGSARGKIAVVNAGQISVRLRLSTDDYSIGPGGRVEIGRSGRSSAINWLTISPTTLDLAPGEQAEVTVSSRVPRTATPGDAHAVVLLTTERTGSSSVGIRSRLGVGVLVRVPGQLKREVAITGLRVVGGRLRIGIANRGNVNERFARGQISVRLRRAGRPIAKLVPSSRSLLPHTSGWVSVRLPRPVRGRVQALVHVRPASSRVAGPGAPRARAVSRSFVLVVPRHR